MSKLTEHLFHKSRLAVCLSIIRESRKSDVREELTAQRLERAIGVMNRPDTELASHYFHAELAHRYDEFIWFDRIEAVHPMTTSEARHSDVSTRFTFTRLPMIRNFGNLSAPLNRIREAHFWPNIKVIKRNLTYIHI